MDSFVTFFKFSEVSQRIPLSSNTVDAYGSCVLERKARAVTSSVRKTWQPDLSQNCDVKHHVFSQNFHCGLLSEPGAAFTMACKIQHASKINKTATVGFHCNGTEWNSFLTAVKLERASFSARADSGKKS